MIVTVPTPPGVLEIAMPHIFQPRLSVSLSLFTTYSVHCPPRAGVEGSFFSLSIIDDDISMVIDCRDMDRCVCVPLR